MKVEGWPRCLEYGLTGSDMKIVVLEKLAIEDVLLHPNQGTNNDAKRRWRILNRTK